MTSEWLSKRKCAKLVQQLIALPPDQRSQKIQALTQSEKAACLKSVPLSAENREFWFELSKANAEECAASIDKIYEVAQRQGAMNDAAYA